jgi:hypothetical protein
MNNRIVEALIEDLAGTAEAVVLYHEENRKAVVKELAKMRAGEISPGGVEELKTALAMVRTHILRTPVEEELRSIKAECLTYARILSEIFAAFAEYFRKRGTRA